MQSFFKKLSNAVTNLVTPRTPLEELTYRWKELQEVNGRIVEFRQRVADVAASQAASSMKLRDGTTITKTALWDQVKEHLEGILECLTAEQDLETGGRKPAPFGSPRRRNIAIGSRGNTQSHLMFQNFNDSLLEATDSEDEDGEPQGNSLLEEHGPCLEYFLQQKIMEKICMMGLSNFPRGMMSICLETAYLVLKNIRQPLLPHHHITTPICQLIHVSLEHLSSADATAQTATGSAPKVTRWGRTRGPEPINEESSLHLMSLVLLIWKSIWRTPHQLDFFTFATSTSPHAALLLAPINGMHLADGNGVGERARGCITTILMLKEPTLESFIAESTHFCQRIAIALANAFDAECAKGEKSEPDEEFSAVKVGHGAAGVTFDAEGRLIDANGRPVLGLQDQVAFVDGVLRIMCFGHAGAAMLADEASCIVSTAGDDDDNSEDEGSKQDPAAQNARENAQDNDAPTLLNALVNALSTTFLARVNEKLLQTSEAAASRATSELSRLIECLAADHRSAGGFYPSPLLSLLGHKVIGAYPIEPLRQTCANVALLQQTSTVGGSAGHNNSGQTGAFYLRRTLINRIDSVSEQLSVATIQLMLALLNSGSPSIRKAFLPNDFATADEAAATDVTLPTLSQWFGLFAGDHATWPTAPRDAAPSTGAATAAAVAALHRRRAFAAYLQDAQANVSLFEISQAGTHSTVYNAEHQPSLEDPLHLTQEESWNFLRTVFRKTERILAQTLDQNVALTAVLSSLAVTTNNPALHKILFCRQEASKDAVEDASAQSKHAQTSLLDILIDIWHEAEGRLGVVADATDKLAWIRASLGASDSVTASEPMSPGGNLADQFETSTGEQRFLRAFVVLEEFVKELAAVAQAKRLVFATRQDEDSQTQHKKSVQATSEETPP